MSVFLTCTSFGGEPVQVTNDGLWIIYPLLPRRLQRLANHTVVTGDGPHHAAELVPTRPAPRVPSLTGRATRVPHRTDKHGALRSTTVNSTTLMSWPPLALAG
jgi:hypothetical protein